MVVYLLVSLLCFPKTCPHTERFYFSNQNLWLCKIRYISTGSVIRYRNTWIKYQTSCEACPWCTTENDSTEQSVNRNREPGRFRSMGSCFSYRNDNLEIFMSRTFILANQIPMGISVSWT